VAANSSALDELDPVAAWKRELVECSTVSSSPAVTPARGRIDLPTGLAPPQGYVYHCHIVEHEDDEMMRPFRVVS